MPPVSASLYDGNGILFASYLDFQGDTVTGVDGDDGDDGDDHAMTSMSYHLSLQVLRQLQEPNVTLIMSEIFFSVLSTN